MKKILLAASAIVGLSASVSSAFAQEYQGLYAGIHAGYNFQSGNDSENILFDTNLDGAFNDTVTTAAGTNAFSPGFCGGRANTPTPAGGCKDDQDAAELGVRVGYDWQFSNWVVGVVGEASWTNLTDSVSAFSTTPARYTMTRDLNWTAALRVRGGAVVQNALVYVTGGYVHGDIDTRFATSNGVNTFTQSGGGGTGGYQLGGGVEWNLSSNWRIGAEYLYTDLCDDDYRVRASGPAPATNAFIRTNANGTDFARGDDSFNYGSLRLTLTYRLSAI